MDAIFSLSQRASYPLLRISMGVVLGWIGALKFADPTPVVGLLGASFSFLAAPGIVYILGAVEVALGLMLLAGIVVRYAGLALMGLFLGTLAIFLIAPKVTYGDAGFPLLSLPGEFLLKDLVLFAVSSTLAGRQPAARAARERADAAWSRAA